ncbi:MAG TPA: SMP-30/gluconolactonase/LRE family protein [Acidobacteriota bacterium]|nr:SMP-30/gluconolactonase/LRE family protein [Acidobacteriota bacterium]
MKRILPLTAACLAGFSIVFFASRISISAATPPDLPSGHPEAVLDLTKPEDVSAVQGQWRYSDVRLIEVDFATAGQDGQPSGPLARTYDYTPHAGAAAYDDSSWEAIAPQTLSRRRGHGRIGFNWYRIAVTLPQQVDGFPVEGSTVVFETALADYAEIWVDGELPRALGQSGGSVVAGWNASNRLVLARNAHPGQKIQIAIFGINGPISDPPTNYIWMRKASLEFFAGQPEAQPYAVEPQEVNVEVVRLDPRIDRIVPANPKLYKLAEGFLFTEGPVWVDEEHSLLFSDPNANRIYRYREDEGSLTVFLEPSGYQGEDVAEYRQPGSNGITLDPMGRTVIAQHGDHRLVRLDDGGGQRVLAESYQGRRLNSPNDLVYRSDGVLYFTDPPFGLPMVFDDPRKELSFSGIYSLREGQLRLENDELSGPNGIALSPDERFLYVGNWDEQRKVVMRYPLGEAGRLGKGEVFFDMTRAPGQDAIDGIKVDREGNLYVSGPDGLWILSDQGEHLGTIIPPRHPHNMAWGGQDGQTLYLCSQDRLYRMRLNLPGIRPQGPNPPTERTLRHE